MSFRHFRLAARLDREALWHFRARSHRCQPATARPRFRHSGNFDLRSSSLDPHSESWHLIIKIGLKCRAATSPGGRAAPRRPKPFKPPRTFLPHRFETMYETMHREGPTVAELTLPQSKIVHNPRNREDQLATAVSIASRLVMTLSTSPKSRASSEVMKWSRSSVFSMVS